MCWFCHWGWPEQVADIYDKYIEIAGESAMHYGSAHIVWDDENFERHHVQYCLDNFEKNPEHTDVESEAVRASLEALLELPDNILYPVPEAYDLNHDASPKNYPPHPSLVMVRR